MENQMFAKTITIGTALLLMAAGPAASQERGTVEFGGFATGTSFDNSLNMNNSFGAGGRVGIFLTPWLALEFDGQGSTATRTLGLRDVNVGMVHGRVTAVPFRVGRTSLHMGVGINDFDTNFHLSYGMHGLIGAKVALSETVALRVDGIQDRMSMGGGANRSLQVGLSYYRHTPSTTEVVTREVPAPVVAQRPDSVSAAETARLRAIEAAHRAMQDSLARAGSQGSSEGASTSDGATIAEVVNFSHDASDVSGIARSILDRKVTVLQAHPSLRMVVTGHTSEPGTDEYNQALGLRRAEAIKSYLVSRGVAASRLETATRGRQEQISSGPGAAAANRRGEFRLLNVN